MLGYEKRRIYVAEKQLLEIDDKINGTIVNHHDKVKYLRIIWDTDSALSGVDLEEVIKNYLHLVQVYAIGFVVERGEEEDDVIIETFAKMSHTLLFGVKRDLGIWRCVSKR